MPVVATTESEVTFELIAKIRCSKFSSVSLAQLVKQLFTTRLSVMYLFDKRIDTLSFDIYRCLPMTYVSHFIRAVWRYSP
jgi:hypothetical protein